MTKDTRYDQGDILLWGAERVEILDVEAPKSDRPNYVILPLDREGHGPEEYKPNGQRFYASDFEAIDKTIVEDYDTFSQAEQDLKQEFMEFEEQGEPFFWEAEVYGKDGSKAVISVDWSSEWDDDFRGVANVIAFKEDQPEVMMTDVETLKESDAVMSAENLVKRAANGLSYYSDKPVKPRITAEYEDRGDSVTGFIDIQWRPMSEVR